jgi:competence protein ComEA
MPLSRSQVVVYGAVALALLLLGARWIRSSERAGAPEGEVAFASGTSQASGGDGRDVVVHVAGAVREPGVYRLPAGSRVTDAVERAGGPTGDGTIDAINLAAPLSDGQQVVVPGGPAAAAGAAGGAAEGPVSLGSATVEDLDAIEGIGPVTAQNIIDYRDEHGGLSSIEELDEVSGIGPVTMDALRDGLQP